ncbi:uncharacterized protein LOC135704650 [Ochlerotatus camptorhynchus]|uniref:uncharacterized protein LOC135704650 n=1 Tax=Ochlerotatus camptorhynchus TaxID=644619 RepID=UPI0031E1EF43
MLLNEDIIANNYIAWEIYKELQDTRENTIKIQWIPSHVGIRGNEVADQAAKQKSREKQTFFNGLTMADALRLSNLDIWADWSRRYKEQSKTKGCWHFNLMETPGRKIWSHELQLNPDEVKTLNRIRSGHALTKSKRATWGWEIDDQCDWCEVKEDIKHILYDCPKFNIERNKYPILEYMKPIEQVLIELCEEELKQITRFIKETKSQI